MRRPGGFSQEATSGQAVARVATLTRLVGVRVLTESAFENMRAGRGARWVARPPAAEAAAGAVRARRAVAAMLDECICGGGGTLSRSAERAGGCAEQCRHRDASRMFYNIGPNPKGRPLLIQFSA